MTRDLIAVHKDTSLNELVDLFIQHKISGSPVVDDQNKLIGIVTKADILSYFMEVDLHLSIEHNLHDILETNLQNSCIDNPSVSETTVNDIMTENPITVEEHVTAETIAKIMLENGIHRLVVVDKNETVGVISTRNILHYVAGI